MGDGAGQDSDSLETVNLKTVLPAKAGTYAEQAFAMNVDSTCSPAPGGVSGSGEIDRMTSNAK
jgi:hypothetical protein